MFLGVGQLFLLTRVQPYQVLRSERNFIVDLQVELEDAPLFFRHPGSVSGMTKETPEKGF